MLDGPSKTHVLHYMFFPGGGIGRYVNEQLIAQQNLGEMRHELFCSPDFAYREQATYEIRSQGYVLGASNPMVRRSRFLVGQFVSPRRLLAYARSVKPDILHFSNINAIEHIDNVFIGKNISWFSCALFFFRCL